MSAEGTIFATPGARRRGLAVRPGGLGKPPATEIVWRLDQGTPDNASPVVWGQSLFVVTNNSGTPLRGHQQRPGSLEDAAEGRVSRLAGGGRGPHLFSQHQGPLHGPLGRSLRLDRLTENQLDDDTLASPVISDGKLFIRGRKSLYCVGK